MKTATNTRNGAGLTMNQRRIAAKVIPVDGIYYCPHKGCKHGPNKTVYTTDNAIVMGTHRRTWHGYVSPQRDAYLAAKARKLAGKGRNKPWSLRKAAEAKTEQVQQPIIYAGCPHCPECGYDLRAENQARVLKQRTMETGESYKLEVTFSSKRHA